MPASPKHHRASYDEDGNIILPGFVESRHVPVEAVAEEVFEAQKPTAAIVPEPRHAEAEPAWQVLDEGIWSEVSWQAESSPSETLAKEEPSLAVRKRIEAAVIPVLAEVRAQVGGAAMKVLEEGTRQYGASVAGGSGALRALRTDAGSFLVRTKSFLSQPVWVPGRNNAPKKYSRGTLFVLDVFRFGGTFASLFLVLFVSLNYQSFWDIVQAKVDPFGQNASAKQLMQDKLHDGLVEKLQHVPSLATAGKSEGNLLSFLPPVGPPEDRIVIPKLNLNVPIVIPPNTALLSENWEQLEQDIQSSLQEGVVHYPGTARPGQAGNFFLTGHSSYFPWAPGKYKSVFARLHDLNVGDEYWVFYGGDRHRYVVQSKEEVSPSDVSVLDQPISKRVATLMTCTPIGTSLRRLIVHAQEVDPLTGDPLEVGEHEKRTDTQQPAFKSLPI